MQKIIQKLIGIYIGDIYHLNFTLFEAVSPSEADLKTIAKIWLG